MDLTDYTCRGFSGDFDRLMRDVPVAGIDRLQTHSMIRLCDATEPILYGPDFSPRRIRYRRASRPRLESIAADLMHNPDKALAWVRAHVQHPHLAGDVRADRAMTEEQLIDSGRGWCNEQYRVFIALCAVMETPARLCFLFHADGRTGHTATEIWRAGRWAMHDVTHGVTVPLGDGTLAEARDLQGAHRRLADGRYQSSLSEYYRGRTAPFDLSRGGDFFHGIGICNYLIDGVEAV